MELVTVGWILEYLVHLVELGLVVVLDEVGYRFTNVLDLLIPITKRSECNGVGILVDNIGAMVPIHDPSDTLMRGSYKRNTINIHSGTDLRVAHHCS